MKQLFLIAMFFSIFLLHVPSAAAHVLESNNGIGAVMHIDPDDSPIVGQPATFFLDLKDETGRFSTVNCFCTVKLYRESEKLLEAPLVPNKQKPTEAQFSYIPDSKGVYRLEVNGKPMQTGQFNDFQLIYTFRVERESGNAPSTSSYPLRKLFIPGVAVIAIILGGGFYLAKKRR